MTDPCNECHDYVDRLFAEKDRWIDARFAGSDRIHEQRVAGLTQWVSSKFDSLQLAVDKAELQIKEKMASENNIREELRNQANTFAPQKQVDALQTFADTLRGQLAVWGVIWGLVVVALSIALPMLLKVK